MKRLLPLLTLTSFLLVACGSTSPGLESTEQAVVAATLATQPTETPTPTETPEPTNTPTATPTPTITPVPTFTLSGIVFFDYNGNGVHDDYEPPIPGATVQMGSLVATTAPDGTYSLENMPAGTQAVRIYTDDFRYISLSLEAFQPSDLPVSLAIEGDTQRNWGLMQGFLTLPISSNIEYSIDRMYDHAQGRQVLWWNGEHLYDPQDTIFYAVPPGTNEHPGIDYGVPVGTEVLAAAPGEVWRIDSVCSSVMLRHLFIDGRPIYTQHAHLSEILVTQGEIVDRGTPIGLSGETCTCYPHIHFDVRSAPNDPDYWAFLDPYVPVVSVPAGFWLSGDPLPQWTDEYHPADGISLWTVENNPQNVW